MEQPKLINNIRDRVVDDLRQIKDKAKKEKREFYIPKLNRERSLYGTDFEIRLRNQLSQKAIAKECAEWVRRKVKLRSNFSQEQMGGFLHVQGRDNCPSWRNNWA